MRRCDCVLAHLNLEMAMASFDDSRFLILNVNLTWGLSGIEVFDQCTSNAACYSYNK